MCGVCFGGLVLFFGDLWFVANPHAICCNVFPIYHPTNQHCRSATQLRQVSNWMQLRASKLSLNNVRKLLEHFLVFSELTTMVIGYLPELKVVARNYLSLICCKPNWVWYKSTPIVSHKPFILPPPSLPYWHPHCKYSQKHFNETWLRAPNPPDTCLSHIVSL